MELFSPKLEFSHLLIGHLESGLVDVGIDFAFPRESCLCGGCGDQVDDDLMTDQRLAAPVLTDEREETVLDLVPFAGARRKVTDRDLQPGFVSQLLQFPFPEPHSRSITAARIGGNQQTLRFGITAATHPAPPAAYALDRELGRVVIHSHANPSYVATEVVDSVGSHLAVLRLTDFEVVNPHRRGSAMRMPFASRILKITHQFLLFGVDRNHRLALFQIALRLAVDVFKLLISIRMLAPLQLLLVGLQAVIHLMKHFRHGLITDSMTLALEFLRQHSYALAGPAKGRLRIPSRHGVDQPVQILAEAGILVDSSFSTCTFAPNPELRGRRLLRYLRLTQFLHAFRDRPA